MVRPIIACENPYETAKQYEAAGWHIDFVQPPESGDPLVGVSLCGNSVLLGVTEGYMEKTDVPHIGCGVEFYINVPGAELERIHDSHLAFSPTDIVEQPWGDRTFKVKIGGHAYMIAGEK
jgi:predicted metalloenzyme YecM